MRNKKLFTVVALSSIALLIAACRAPETASEQKSLDNTMIEKSYLTVNTCGGAEVTPAAKAFAELVAKDQPANIQTAVASSVSGFSKNDLDGFSKLVRENKLSLHFDLKECKDTAAKENGVVDPIFCFSHDSDKLSMGLHFGKGSYKNKSGIKTDMDLEASIRHGLVRGLSYVMAAMMSERLIADKEKVGKLASNMGFKGEFGFIQAVAETIDSAVCSESTRDVLDTNKDERYTYARDLHQYLLANDLRVID
jgi:hypothetical protein